MGKADLHVHTAFSDGMAEARELLDYVEAETDLDVLAVTDHDDIRGAWQAREVWAQGNYRFDFVTGVEVTAIEGHVLALYVEAPVPNLRPLAEVLAAVHRQGGLCVAPHPLNWLTRSLGARELRRLSASGRDGVHLDGIELANCSPGSGLRRGRALALNRGELKLAEVGGSDAHFLDFVGSAYTEFPGRTAAALKGAILERRTAAVNGTRPGFRQIGARRLAQQTWRGFLTTPRRMGWGPTAYSFVRGIFRLP
ncbi:MAG: PHP-associated domain-containing protein [Dehalococcoidia bacterium]|nr:PHP-associated domain-containing protein [Dehalococcoidia bacterium]